MGTVPGVDQQHGTVTALRRDALFSGACLVAAGISVAEGVVMEPCILMVGLGMHHLARSLLSSRVHQG